MTLWKLSWTGSNRKPLWNGKFVWPEIKLRIYSTDETGIRNKWNFHSEFDLWQISQYTYCPKHDTTTVIMMTIIVIHIQFEYYIHLSKAELFETEKKFYLLWIFLLCENNTYTYIYVWYLNSTSISFYNGISRVRRKQILRMYCGS